MALSAHKKVLFVGDSTTVGVGAGSGGSTDVNGSRSFSTPLKCRDRLISLGINSTANDVCADNNNGRTNTEWNGYRSDITVTGTLQLSSQTPTVGGAVIRQASGSALSFTTNTACDTVEFAYPRNPAFGTLQMTVDGGSATTYDQSLATDLHKVTVSGLALSTHTFAFSQNPATAHGPTFINAYNSAVPAIQVLNAGARNWKIEDWIGSTNPSNPLNAIAVIDPDVVVIDLGINNWGASGTTISGFKTNMQTLIDECVSAGAEIILCVPNPIASYNTVTDSWSLAATITAYEELQAANSGSVLVNTPEVYFTAGLSGATNPADYTALNANGYMHDALHPTAEPYEAEGNAIADALVDLLGLSGGGTPGDSGQTQRGGLRSSLRGFSGLRGL